MPDTNGAARLEAIINRFEDAWERGERPEVVDHLPADDAHRFALLVELVHVDLENRLKAGEPARVEDYLRRYPELGGARGVVRDLIDSEWAIRKRGEPSLGASEYAARFPELRDELRDAGTQELTPATRTQRLRPDPGATECFPPTNGRAGDEPAAPILDLETRCRYHTPRLYAQGGLGEILKARDDELNRDVALKRLRGRRADDPESRSRFLREAAITGQLEHPGVVPVYGLGQTADGSPVYAMRLIRGETFQEAAERFHRTGGPRADSRDRLLEFRQLVGRLVSVCNTVAFAHSRGIIHRDLKPGNILLGAFGETLVVDWGLAKRTGEAAGEGIVPAPAAPTGADLTQDGAVIGTPAYMSPEQAAGRWDQVGGASDVYSLGATLYVLLTGRPPFSEGDLYQVLERVRGADYDRPRDVVAGVPPALEAVCLKAMALRPEDRYPDALTLAADLERWLAGEPVTAWREPLRLRARRWVSRHATLVTAAGIGLVAVAGLAVVTSLWAAAAERERGARNNAQHFQEGQEAAQRQAEERSRLLAVADQERYWYQVTAADREWMFNRFDRSVERLGKCPEDLRRWEWNHLMRRCQDGVLTLTGHTKEVWSVAYSPDGRRLASASLDGTVKIWDADTGRELFRCEGHEGPVWGIAFSPDGKTVASGSADRSVRLWDAATGKLRSAFTDQPGEVHGVAYSPDGSRVAAVVNKPPSKGEVRVLDTLTGKPLLVPPPSAPLSGVTFSHDGRFLAAGAVDSKVMVWDATTGEVLSLTKAKGHLSRVATVAFSPDDKRLASAGHDGVIQVWNIAAGTPVATLRGHARPVWGVCFSPDGTRLASSSDDHSVRVWDLEQRRILLTLYGHKEGIANVVYSPDGKHLASAGDDKTVRIWNATRSASAFTLPCPKGPAWAVACSPDGQRIAVGEDEAVRIWDVASRRPVLTLPVPKGAGSVAFAPDGKSLAAALDDGTVRLWYADGKEVQILRGHKDRVQSIAFSPDGLLLASASADRTARLWDVATGESVAILQGHTAPVRAVAFSPDGKLLASGSEDRTVRLWDVAGRSERTVLSAHATGVACLAFSPDGTRLAVGTLHVRKVVTWEGGEVVLWDPATGKEERRLKGHDDDVRALTFSPDGGRLVTGGADLRIKLWEPNSGEQIVTLMGQHDCINGIAFSRPDGQYLATASCDGTVLVRDGSPPEAPH